MTRELFEKLKMRKIKSLKEIEMEMRGQHLEMKDLILSVPFVCMQHRYLAVSCEDAQSVVSREAYSTDT